MVDRLGLRRACPGWNHVRLLKRRAGGTRRGAGLRVYSVDYALTQADMASDAEAHASRAPSPSWVRRADPLAYPVMPTVVGELSPERLRKLPPTIIVNADADELRASGEQFAEQLSAAGVRVTQALQPGTVHGYLNRPEESDQARADARATIDRFVAELRAIHHE